DQDLFDTMNGLTHWDVAGVILEKHYQMYSPFSLRTPLPTSFRLRSSSSLSNRSSEIDSKSAAPANFRNCSTSTPQAKHRDSKSSPRALPIGFPLNRASSSKDSTTMFKQSHSAPRLA